MRSRLTIRRCAERFASTTPKNDVRSSDFSPVEKISRTREPMSDSLRTSLKEENRSLSWEQLRAANDRLSHEVRKHGCTQVPCRFRASPGRGDIRPFPGRHMAFRKAAYSQ